MIICNKMKKFKQLYKINFKFCTRKLYENYKPPWNVLFFGTDDFSVISLKALCSEHKTQNILQKLEVVTCFKNNSNPIQQYAEQENLPVHRWPVHTIDEYFHIGVVVSFGYLIPEKIIQSFPLGMINVHASLLPRWRGAAPIIYTIANGDEKTGITIMRIKPNKFDVGEILLQKEINVSEDVMRATLSTKLAKLGAEVLVKAIHELPHILNKAKPQPQIGVTYAPKINSSLAAIEWKNMSAKYVYNMERALSGIYSLTTKWNNIPIKLIGIKLRKESETTNSLAPGSIMYDKNNKLIKVICADGKWISVENVGVYKKRVMKASDFYNGYLSKQPNVRIFR